MPDTFHVYSICCREPEFLSFHSFARSSGQTYFCRAHLSFFLQARKCFSVKFKLQGDAWTLKTGSASLCEHIIQSYVAIFRKTHTETRESSIGFKSQKNLAFQISLQNFPCRFLPCTVYWLDSAFMMFSSTVSDLLQAYISA